MARRDSLNARLHAVLALLAVWLVATSPWVSMLRRIPADAGFFDYAHILLGGLALAVGAFYAFAVTRDGRLRQYVPGKAAGITGVIEGLLLLALIATGVTGALWFMTQGAAEALAWRAWHAGAARVLIAVSVAHVLAVTAHLLDF
jgi:hypothetical protein